MADANAAGQNSADEAARRAAEERARRIAAIQAEINMWNGKLARVESQIASLTTEQASLNTYLEDWESQKSIYSGSEILSEVVIVNVFEGVCADSIKADFTDSITEMDQTHSDVGGLNGNVGEQISRLNQYKSDINSKLTALRNELNSI